MRKNIESIKPEIFNRDGRQCRYCGDTNGPFHIDHVYPASKGGVSTSNNLVVSCASCNLNKHAKIGVWPYPIGYFNDIEDYEKKLLNLSNYLNKIIYRLIIIVSLLLYFTIAIFVISEILFGGNSVIVEIILIIFSSLTLLSIFTLWGVTR